MISIDVLPDEILLAIFDFSEDKVPLSPYNLSAKGSPLYAKRIIETWHSLVHVCQRWRRIIFASPRRLNLRLFCTPETRRDTLDVWPPFPLVISGIGCRTKSVDNIVTLLEHSDRVCQIALIDISSSHHIEQAFAATQTSFPQLTDLMLWASSSPDENPTKMPVLSDSFLGGFAPHLRELSLDRIPFPGLPKLLSSATNLVGLHLFFIPHSGYFPPEEMLDALSTSTNLRSLHLQFKSPRSRPSQATRSSSPPTRSVLPFLSSLKFKGASEYLEVIVAGIDAPQLSTLFLSFFNEIEFGAPKLVRFICHTPLLKELVCASISFEYDAARVNLSSGTPDYRTLNVGILCREGNLHLSSLVQFFTLSLPPLSTLGYLFICEGRGSPLEDWHIEITPSQWLELLHPFAAVRHLYLSTEMAPYITLALEELVGSRATEILPNLEVIFLEGLESSGFGQEDIGEFVASRQVTSHPIDVTLWERKVEEEEDYDGEDFDMDYDD